MRIDGAALDQWSAEALGPHIGYLPQDMELFAGSVAQNIARFEPDANSEKVIDAAGEACLHELILGLLEGYEAEIGESGAALSVGSRLFARQYGQSYFVPETAVPIPSPDGRSHVCIIGGTVICFVPGELRIQPAPCLAAV